MLAQKKDHISKTIRDPELSNAPSSVRPFESDLLSKLNVHTGKKFGIKASGNPLFRNQARGTDALTLLANEEKEENIAMTSYYKAIQNNDALLRIANKVNDQLIETSAQNERQM